ncbi:MAG: 3-hydroxyacyl-ACP dehydratase FabZ [Gammaproteobacteria bacterium]|nr:3-hydroxyacyl-ACP dehydratase FabZ [Gammaproteobacteria bacterium]
MNNTILTDIKIRDILKRLPHRYPFILVDRVLSLEPGGSITALKNVAGNEGCFQGHFPNTPVMPGVLILESLAQACALLFIYSMEHKCFNGYTQPDNGIFLFAGMDNVRFKKVVEPGDQLILEGKLVKIKKDLAKFSTQAFVDNQLVCSAEMLSAYRNIEE